MRTLLPARGPGRGVPDEGLPGAAARARGRGAVYRGPIRRRRPQDLPPDAAAAIRDALAAERQQTLDRITAVSREFDGIVESSAGVATDDEHDPEGATIAFERAQLAALLDQAHRHLAELDEAAGRFRQGRYGRCERCGRPNAAERLTARPTARTCIACADRA